MTFAVGYGDTGKCVFLAPIYWNALALAYWHMWQEQKRYDIPP